MSKLDDRPRAPSNAHPALLWLLGAAGTLVLSGAFVHQFLRYPSDLFGGDWLQMQFYWEAPRQVVLRYGQIPLWNPFYCGGNLLLAHPNTQILTPFFGIALLVGTSLAYRISLVLHLTLGVFGMERLGRDLGLYGAARVLVALTFPFCGFFAWHLVGGHMWAQGFLLLPWLYLCYLRAIGATRHSPPSGRRWPYLFWGGLVLALMVFDAGVYSVPFSGLALGVDALTRAIAPERGRGGARERLRPLFAAAAIGALGFLISGPKSFPLMAYLREHHRTFNVAEDALMPVDVARMFFARSRDWLWDQGGGRFWYRWWGEYANDIGYPVFLLAAYALFTARRQTARAVLCTLIFLALMLGEHGPLSPYALLRELPVYKGLRVPSRFTILVTFFVAVAAAFGLQRLLAALRRRYGPNHARAAAAVLLLLCVAEPFVHQMRVNVLNKHQSQSPVAKAGDFHQIHGTPRWMYRHSMENRGLLDCYEEAQLERGEALRAGKVPQQWPTSHRAGRVRSAYWSPNRLVFEVTAWAPMHVAVNQNHHHGWEASAGATIRPYRGQLGFEVEPGVHRVELRYRPKTFVAGCAASGAVLLLWVLAGALGAALRRLARRAPGSGPRRGARAGSGSGPGSSL